MELESETYEKYLNDDIHELPDCRISKLTKLPSLFFAVRLKDLSKFHELENVSPQSLKSSYVIKRCVLNK